jgi:hypothetical protein
MVTVLIMFLQDAVICDLIIFNTSFRAKPPRRQERHGKHFIGFSLRLCVSASDAFALPLLSIFPFYTASQCFFSIM